MEIAIKPGEVYTFKLNSGEELVAKATASNAHYVIIENPVSIAPGPQGMGLIPSMFTADTSQEIRLNTGSVSLYAVTEDAVKMKYIEATTGIRVPDRQLILG
jgi:hypothetical protein